MKFWNWDYFQERGSAVLSRAVYYSRGTMKRGDILLKTFHYSSEYCNSHNKSYNCDDVKEVL